VSPARTVEPVEMPLGMWTHGRQGNHVLDGARIPLPDGMGTCASPYAHSTVYGLCVWIECVCGCSYICEFAAAMRPLTKLILTLFSCILAASELCSERRRCGEVSGHMVGESILSTRCPHCAPGCLATVLGYASVRREMLRVACDSAPESPSSQSF